MGKKQVPSISLSEFEPREVQTHGVVRGGRMTLTVVACVYLATPGEGHLAKEFKARINTVN